MNHRLRTGAITALEFLVVVATVAAMSWLVVRSHTPSIWMDMEFTGWVAPIANRLGDGVRLYSEHRHSPMPPLPALITYAISGGHATWLTESLTIAVCQSILVAVMYLGLAGYLPRPIPLVASLLSVPVYFALAKTISYDAITQALVAVSAVVAVAVAGAAPRGPTPWWRWAAGPGLCALLVATTILAKQSTGVGLGLGVGLALAVVGPRTWPDRLARASAFAVLTPAMFAGLCLLISPWVDVRGMIQDVFVIGSEPKGGSRLVLDRLGNYAFEVSDRVIPFLIYGVAFAGIIRGWPRGEAGPTTDPAPAPYGGLTVLAVSLAAIAAPVVLVALIWPAPWAFWLQYAPATAARTALWAGLLMLILSAFGRRPLGDAPAEGRAAGGVVALCLVLFPAAVFHSLSVPDFRWTYDNNPLISVAMAGLVSAFFAVVFGGAGKRPGWLGGVAAVAGVVVLSGVIWSLFAAQWNMVRSCTEEWPEVAHLKGARLRPAAVGLRALVARVRQLAPDPKQDAVLLLPNDPNVEAWFDRPRPDLSSLVIFADQYWDRYVERDFEALTQDPPRVIVVGPRGYWRGFRVAPNVGSERLIDLVLGKLVPARYTQVDSQPIFFQGRVEYMDIYVRNDAKKPQATAVLAR